MGPREEDNGALLLAAVAFICGLIALAPSLLEPGPAIAAQAIDQPIRSEAHLTSAQPVRVIVPFTPNTMPGER